LYLKNGLAVWKIISEEPIDNTYQLILDWANKCSKVVTLRITDEDWSVKKQETEL
jgi:hypothetical protein